MKFNLKSGKLMCLPAIVVLLMFCSALIHAQTANINLSSQQQSIRGFGAANIIYWRPDMTDSEIETAFGTGPGQPGFSILRIMLEADQSRWNLYVPTCQKAQAGVLISGGISTVLWTDQ